MRQAARNAHTESWEAGRVATVLQGTSGTTENTSRLQELAVLTLPQVTTQVWITTPPVVGCDPLATFIFGNI